MGDEVKISPDLSGVIIAEPSVFNNAGSFVYNIAGSSVFNNAGSFVSNIAQSSGLNPVAEPFIPKLKRNEKKSNKNIQKQQLIEVLLKKNKRSISFETLNYQNDKIQEVIAASSSPHNDQISITFKDTKFSVSKSILTDTCQYFRMKLNSTFKDGKSASNHDIEFDVSVGIFKQILGYLTTGAIQLSTANLADVTKFTSFLLLEDLKKFCLDVFKQNMDCESVDYVHVFADEYFLSDVSKAALLFKVKKFETVWKSGVFLSWKFEYIHEIVRSDLVVVSEEKKVVSFLLKWLTADYEERSKNATELLQNLRYSFLTKDNLNKVVEENGQQLSHTLFQIAERFSGKDTASRLYHQKGIYMLGMTKFEKYLPDDDTIKLLPSPDSSDGSPKVIVANKDKIFAFDTRSVRSLSCQRYDPLKDTWEPRASMSVPRAFYVVVGAVCSFEDEIFVFFTYYEIVEAYHSDRQIVGTMQGIGGWIYSVKTDRWRPVQVPTGLFDTVSSATTCGESIYLVSHNITGISKILQYTPSIPWVWVEIPCSTRRLHNYEVVAHKFKLLFIQNCKMGFPTNMGITGITPTNRMVVFCTKTKEFKESVYNNRSTILPIVLFNDYLYIARCDRHNFNWTMEKMDPVFMDDAAEDPTPIPVPGWKSSFHLNSVMVSID